jgi:uncharacterized protein (UPF0332 family)
MKELRGKINWCMKQKRGIKIDLPNDNLCDAYLKKARNSLKAMQVNNNEGLIDWAVDAAYYARYHIIYSLLQKCGIKCETHDFSIMLIKLLFLEELDNELISELEEAKKQRINLVYYTDRLVPDMDIRQNIAMAPNFLLKVEEIIDGVSKEKINEVRKELKEIK